METEETLLKKEATRLVNLFGVNAIIVIDDKIDLIDGHFPISEIGLSRKAELINYFLDIKAKCEEILKQRKLLTAKEILEDEISINMLKELERIPNFKEWVIEAIHQYANQFNGNARNVDNLDISLKSKGVETAEEVDKATQKWCVENNEKGRGSAFKAGYNEAMLQYHNQFKNEGADHTDHYYAIKELESKINHLKYSVKNFPQNLSVESQKKELESLQTTINFLKSK